jgi:hypothetical protein
MVDAVEEWDMKVPQENSSIYLPAKGEHNIIVDSSRIQHDLRSVILRLP